MGANDTAPARAPQASVIMARKATAATAAPSASGCGRRRSTIKAAMKASSAAAPTRCQVRLRTFGRSAMLAQTAPLTTSAATCGPAACRASSWMQPMPNAAAMPLIA
jgi:hypothetical protein